MVIPYLGIFVRTANSEISGALLSLMLKPFMGTCVNMRNTENSEIRMHTTPKLYSHDDICDETRLDSRFSHETAHALAKEFSFSILFFENASFVF